MRTVALTKESTKDILENLLKRSPNNYGKFEAAVDEILNKVKTEGDAALFAYTKEFDKTEISADTIKVTEEEIKARVAELGKQIEKDFEGQDLLVVGILKGASVFVADLIRNINLDVNMDFMSVSSYGNAMESSGSVKILKDLDVDIKGKNVLIVEDIIDSGLTLSNLTKELGAREPKSLKICTLLDKPERRKADIPVDYVGFVIEDKFIVGYGIDYAEKYRNLPYIGIVEDV